MQVADLGFDSADDCRQALGVGEGAGLIEACCADATAAMRGRHGRG